MEKHYYMTRIDGDYKGWSSRRDAIEHYTPHALSAFDDEIDPIALFDIADCDNPRDALKCIKEKHPTVTLFHSVAAYVPPKRIIKIDLSRLGF